MSDETKMSNRAAGFAFALTAVLTFVAWKQGYALWVCAPLALLFSAGVAMFADSFDQDKR